MISVIFMGGDRAEVGGSSYAKSLKSLGGGKSGSSGSSHAKSLKSLRAEAEVKHPSKLGVAASGGGPRFLSTRGFRFHEVRKAS